MPKQNKGFALILAVGIILIVSVLTAGGVLVYQQNKNANKPIGGDKDEHGCLIPAGYSWCEIKNKCLRVWEEKCEKEITVKDETVDWKKYTNTQYGFEIKYPKGSIVTEGLTATIILPKMGDESITESINIVSSNMSVCDYAYQYYPETVKIDNVNFKKDIDRTGGTASRSYTIFYVLKKDNKCLEIVFSAGGNKASSLNEIEESKLFEEILSTFKFTK